MSLDREIQRLKGDPAAFRATAAALLAISDNGWSEWERTFVEEMAQRRSSEPPSTRQCEKLLELRDSIKSYRTIEGLSVRLMIEHTWAARDELEEADESFLEALYRSGTAEIRRRQLKRLLACARKAEVIDHYIRLD